MAFDAFEQFIAPGSNAPKVEGEDETPPEVQPSRVAELQEEQLPDVEGKISDKTATRNP